MDVPDPVFRDFGDVQQPFRARKDLDEGSEVHHLHHRPQIGLPDFGGGRQLFDDPDRLFGRLAAGGSDVDGAVVFDVDLHSRLIDDAADHLPAGTDDPADLLDRDLDGDDTRRQFGNVGARLGYGRGHPIEDVQPALPGLEQRFLHDLSRDPGNLDVHLQRGDAVPAAGDLEVHIAVVVLESGDIRQDRIVLSLLDQSHGDTGDGSLERHACVLQRHDGAADGRHGRRAVGLQDVRDHADRVGELLLRWKQRRDRSLRQGSVPDFPAARASQEPHLSHAEGREVVVEHETFRTLPGEQIQALGVISGAQRGRHQGLGLGLA